MKTMAYWRQAWYHLLSLWAPPICPGCGQPAGKYALTLLCHHCKPLPRKTCLCQQCGRALPITPMAELTPPRTCRWCRRLKPNFEQARSLSAYTSAWRRAVGEFKMAPAGVLAEQMVNMLRHYLRSWKVLEPWQGIVPVPGRSGTLPHAAYFLARRLAARLHLPYWPVLYFRRRTHKQRGLRRQDRFTNMQQAISINKNNVAGKSLLLIDDVMTTGATVNECSRVLKQAQAKRVEILTLARSCWSWELVFRSWPESPAHHTIAVVK